MMLGARGFRDKRFALVTDPASLLLTAALLRLVVAPWLNRESR